jgi:hypothetical protein
MERVGDREEKMEGSCSTGQSPQWAVVPMEEEVKYPGRFFLKPVNSSVHKHLTFVTIMCC